ncbi:MAG: 50S ribosomal protein L29 [Nitrospirae bacterium CG_4_10_14_0_8_um_filter_41_23]|nr:50S ribosomal protein L29 [Nitrospirota bacterium]OIP60601.1 MAG: 50S ribosomal protein L29 [Nitrospirae bacterium CG2_30_41_42]PIQ94997.1 MAG: 50S ribosomal protein L29 [Nitrospirae bacterium CG11_big_fil_rev_8_21_14_0_20_41_14]PIV41477.1 MAG: 50S ribosomal protein L29 [Nitrospirae bacterium CG02_land_8_20_14_3_00_41_53]PIW87147.1 MAG: 50S ribosomal protein L29 [Nitrospirae bacterium CG_4_8_14_3_um_filter_41_47]PIY87093.1 MAG: 50S ribosomal protein L29 [Nitrospirae bacterium CG_4_10_14_0_8
MKPSELKAMTIDELTQKEQDLRKELFNLRFQQATGEIENPMRLHTVKKDIARTLTIKSEKLKAGR